MTTVRPAHNEPAVQVIPVVSSAPTEIRLELRAEPVEPTISLRDLLAALARRWWLILLGGLIAAVGAYAFSQTTTPLYSANIVLAPAETNTEQLGSAGGLGALSQLAGLATGDKSVQNGLATLGSRQFLTDFIITYRLRPILYPERWDAAGRSWRPVELGAKSLFLAPDGGPSLEDAYYKFSKMLTVKKDAGSDVIRLALEWKDPVQVTAWLNALIHDLNARFRAKAIQHSDLSIQYLTEQLKTVSNDEVRSSIFRLIEAQMKRRTTIVVTPDYLFEVLDPATPPVRPSFPNPILLTVLGFVVGTVLAAGGLALVNSWRSSRAAGVQSR